jgi:hypothetical protein
MSIILPKTLAIKIYEIEERLDILKLKQCFEQDRENSVNISFPKFKFEYEKEVLLRIYIITSVLDLSYRLKFLLFRENDGNYYLYRILR